MIEYLEFKKARCKDCYKCLRDCPVKAIEVKDHQAKIIPERCILCGRCTIVCPQNAKIVHSEMSDIKEILLNNTQVIASVAPSFISSFGLQDFSIFRIALGKLGFSFAEETAVGANAVTKEYKKLMEAGGYDNFITSACPSVCRMIQEYFPKALKFLAQVDSPMIAHGKILKKQYPDAKIIFIGPCIAKKREAKESGIFDGVLTFEDIEVMFKEKNIILEEITNLKMGTKKEYANLAKAYPISHGIIKSFDSLPAGYEYMAVDGPDRCVQVLDNIESFSGVFLEMNMCQDACVNGPCSLMYSGDGIRATMDIRKYVNREISTLPPEDGNVSFDDVDIRNVYPRMRNNSTPPIESQIVEILKKTGKTKPEDELNCGACGYSTCREKAWAVLNGYADIDICLPFMRERAESMSYEIIHSSPDGLVVLDPEMKIIDINNRAKELLGIQGANLKGMPAVDFFNPTDFLLAYTDNKPLSHKRIYVSETKKYIDLSITILKGNEALFGILRDITDMVCYNEKLGKVKLETLQTTDNVIKKQMRVAQEIASLLGETTAETKVALLKLKKTLQEEEESDK